MGEEKEEGKRGERDERERGKRREAIREQIEDVCNKLTNNTR